MPEPRQTLLSGIGLVPSGGGVPKTIEQFRKALDACVVSFTDPRQFDKEGTAFDGIVHVMTRGSRAARAYCWPVAGSVDQAETLAARADLISCHVMLRYHAHWIRKMAIKHDIPYWFVPHGQLDPYVYTYRPLVKRIWIELFGKRLLREAAHVIYATDQERRKAEWVHKSDNSRVVHWPVELIDLEERALARISVRGRIGAGNNDKVLLFLGRLHPMKRPLETIDAFCRDSVGGAHLVLIGMENGVTFGECEQRAQQHGMSSNVHVVGPLFGEVKEEWLLGSDGYISLSRRENFNHTAAESLAAGIPVILSPGNDLAADLRSRKCGWFLNTDDIHAAIGALREWRQASNESLRDMGMRGRSFIFEECSFERFRESLVALREEAIRNYRERGTSLR